MCLTSISKTDLYKEAFFHRAPRTTPHTNLSGVSVTGMAGAATEGSFHLFFLPFFTWRQGSHTRKFVLGSRSETLLPVELNSAVPGCRGPVTGGREPAFPGLWPPVTGPRRDLPATTVCRSPARAIVIKPFVISVTCGDSAWYIVALRIYIWFGSQIAQILRNFLFFSFLSTAQ